MIVKLNNLKKYLISCNYFEEANIVEEFIKMAVPIVDILDLPVDDEPIQKNVMMNDKYKIEDWYGALSALGTNVILIPFNEEKINNNRKVIEGFLKIFGIDDYKAYKDIKRNINYFEEVKHISNDIGSLEKLKESFPRLWQEIFKKLSELGIPENDVVYVLYNKDIRNPENIGIPPQQKTPKYLSHDIGHAETDTKDLYQENRFRDIVFEFFLEMCKYYKLNDNITLKDFISDKKTIPLKYIFYDIIDEFFDSKEFFSEKGDNFYDVYSDALSGKINYKRPYVISFEDMKFILDTNKLDQIKSLEDKMLNDLMSHVRSKETGPLHLAKGKVILYDTP